MTTKRAWSAVLSLVLFAALAAGCGSDNNDDSSSQTTSTPATVPITRTTTAPAKNAKPGPKPPKPPSGGGGNGSPPAPPRVVVPDLVGKSLADAQAALSNAGFSFVAEAKSGDRTEIRTSWEVCQTVPKPGARAPVNSPITLITAAPGAC